ncbi:unnamed protein product [Discula destructiva]
MSAPALFTAQLHPGRALGWLVLGASLHDILTRVKAEPQLFPTIHLVSDTERPFDKPVVVILPANGIRLNFDGTEQRLRLVEVIDFTKNHITFKDQNTERDLVKPPAPDTNSPAVAANPKTILSAEPTFKHIYQRFLGPTYDGEFLPPADGSNMGNYVLSYPGVALTFPLPEHAYSPTKDVVSLLSSATQPATSMAVFSGESWAQARKTLWTEPLPSIKTFAPLVKGKDVYPDEVSMVKIYGGGKLQLFKNWSNTSTWLHLGETTEQDLVRDLGPPDAIYQKSDQHMYVHQIRPSSTSRNRTEGDELRRQDDLTDTDLSSAQSASGDSNDDEAADEDAPANPSGERFFNYFYLGFDVLLSTRTTPSQAPPSQDISAVPQKPLTFHSPNRVVATKVVLHGNVPGSYPFNRHRRARWEIAYLDQASPAAPISAETPWPKIQTHLRTEWQSAYASEADAAQKQRGMVLNRGWGDSPGSSIELLGGWEDSVPSSTPAPGTKRPDGSDDTTTTLYGFPGLVFEVLRNEYVSAVTVF